MSTTVANDTIVAEITIKASAERIYEALVNPDQRVKWWGVKGRFETTEVESDLRVGGHWAMRGTGMGGKPFNVAGQYRIVERPRCSPSPGCRAGTRRRPRLWCASTCTRTAVSRPSASPIQGSSPKAPGRAIKAGRRS